MASTDMAKNNLNPNNLAKKKKNNEKRNLKTEKAKLDGCGRK